jgi:hypothetical protein
MIAYIDAAAAPAADRKSNGGALRCTAAEDKTPARRRRQK